MPASNPVIIVPGITATYLRDEYPVPPEIIWSVIKKDYARAGLHPDNLGLEATQPSLVRPDQVFEIVYEQLIEELRFNIRDREDDPVPVYPFSYDWRLPLESIDAALSAFVDEVIERTKLMRNYFEAGYSKQPKVNLVGHSMGGLIIAGYLQSRGGEKVDKVASLASPFQGSFESVIKITTGTANLGTTAPSSRERKAARLTPSLYYLMPSFGNGLEMVGDDLPDTLFDRGAWQPSILTTIEEYIRLHGVDGKKRKPKIKSQAEGVFDDMLARGKSHRERIDGLQLQDAGLSAKDWLCVVGVNAVTRVRLVVEQRDGEPSFVFRSSDRFDGWDDSDERLQRMTGDGTVPFEGSIPKFLPYESLVCVAPADFGYWEMQDRMAMQAGGFHGILPNMNMLHRLIVRHFTGRADRYGNTWGRPAPGVTAARWNPPVDDLRNKEL